MHKKVIKSNQTQMNNKKARSLDLQGFLAHYLMRRKGLEPSQEKLPLEPESSASAIPPSPLTTTIIAQSGRHCKCFLQKNKFFS